MSQGHGRYWDQLRGGTAVRSKAWIKADDDVAGASRYPANDIWLRSVQPGDDSLNLCGREGSPAERCEQPNTPTKGSKFGWFQTVLCLKKGTCAGGGNEVATIAFPPGPEVPESQEWCCEGRFDGLEVHLIVHFAGKCRSAAKSLLALAPDGHRDAYIAGFAFDSRFAAPTTTDIGIGGWESTAGAAGVVICSKRNTLLSWEEELRALWGAGTGK
ncbi:unnamed protein product [Symbiodinium necroappetens]|uniref:Uncharacterized protein n=1 Tax=Symbiodinium necroappetens TaxID=1628268 RepID=A0A812Q470_9DINO|nr:unnamed protein product [Symbiodinium necroappetens]